MNTSVFEIKSFRLKSRLVIIAFVAAAMLMLLGIIVLTHSTKITLLAILICGPLILGFPITVLYFLTEKITFNTDGVVQSSILQTTRLKIENIRTYGVFQQRRFISSRTPVEPDQVGEDNYPYLTHFIFLSTSESFDLTSLFPKKNIRLQYRRSEYDMIKQWMENVSTQTRDK